MKNKKLLYGLFAFLILLIVGFVVWTRFERKSDGIACTLEAKVCPDGSAVGRNGANNCEFDPCPAM